MTLENLDLFHDNVDALIKDEDKLITYKWLSKELEVHVNTAKEILRTYWESHKNDTDATFVVKGKLPDGSLRLEVTRASNLENAKEKFSRLDFEHIYSVQKTLSDLDLLANAGDGDVKFSAIKLSNNILRDELPKSVRSLTSSQKAKENEAKIVNVAKKEEKEKERKKDTKKDIKKDTKKDKEEKKDVEKEKDAEKEKEKSQKNKDASPEDKKGPAKSKTSDSNGKGKTVKKPVQSTKAGFNHLFGKVASQPKPPPKVEKPSVPEEKKEKETKKDVSEKSSEDSPPEKKEVKSTKKTSKPEPVRAKLKSQSKKGKSKKESDAKKRKRVIAQLDSSDDDVEVNKSDESEPEEIIVEERPKKRKTPSPIPVGPGKVKIRKMVSKTSKDEDGFFRTEQVAVFEEVDVEPEPQPKLEPKIVEPSKNKQTKLTSFFKRS